MKIGQLIKEKREEMGISIDELALMAYSTSKAISNYENDLAYPDMDTLELLSEIFDMTIEDMCKEDYPLIKQELNNVTVNNSKDDNRIITILIVLTLLSLIPLFVFFNSLSILLWTILYGVCLWYAFRLTRNRNSDHIKIYRELIDYLEGKKTKEETYEKSGSNRLNLLLIIGAVVFLTVLLIGVPFILKG